MAETKPSTKRDKPGWVDPSKPEVAADEIAAMNLYQKLSAITGEIGSIAKGGQNSEQHYSFIEYAAVAGALRTLFAKYHVMCLPNMGERHAEHFTSSYGKQATATTITFVFTFVNSDKPDETHAITWVGEAIDYGDKGTNKAATAALKYCLMRTFNVSEKGDEDPDSASPDRGEPAKAASQPEAKAKEVTITLNDVLAKVAARMSARGFEDVAQRKTLLLKIAGIDDLSELNKENINRVSEVVETATTAQLRGYLDLAETMTSDTPHELPDLTAAIDPYKKATLAQVTRIKIYMRGKGVTDEEAMADQLVDNFGVQDGRNLTQEEAAAIIEHFSKLAKKKSTDQEIIDGAGKAFPDEAETSEVAE